MNKSISIWILLYVFPKSFNMHVRGARTEGERIQQDTQKYFGGWRFELRFCTSCIGPMPQICSEVWFVCQSSRLFAFRARCLTRIVITCCQLLKSGWTPKMHGALIVSFLQDYAWIVCWVWIYKCRLSTSDMSRPIVSSLSSSARLTRFACTCLIPHPYSLFLRHCIHSIIWKE